jgi:DNA-binding protein HU-beta
MISRATAVLRENNARKPVSIPKQVFHISDDEGNSKDFPVKKIDKSVLYTTDDVEVMLDALIQVIEEALKNGESVAVHGFGKLSLAWRKEHTVKNVLDGKPVTIEGFYTPKFYVGNDLKRCAQIYEQKLKDEELKAPLPVFTEGL